MFDEYGEACFTPKNVYKHTKHGFATMSPSQKGQFIEWKYTDSLVKKKFWVQQSEKKVMLTVF